MELALANLRRPPTWKPGSPARGVGPAPPSAALEGLSLLSADGRRRLFALRGSSGQRVGPAAVPPVPGKPATFWALFPAADGPVSLLLPGFAPLRAGRRATPSRPEP